MDFIAMSSSPLQAFLKGPIYVLCLCRCQKYLFCLIFPTRILAIYSVNWKFLVTCASQINYKSTFLSAALLVVLLYLNAKYRASSIQ